MSNTWTWLNSLSFQGEWEELSLSFQLWLTHLARFLGITQLTRDPVKSRPFLMSLNYELCVRWHHFQSWNALVISQCMFHVLSICAQMLPRLVYLRQLDSVYLCCTTRLRGWMCRNCFPSAERPQCLRKDERQSKLFCKCPLGFLLK